MTSKSTKFLTLIRESPFLYFWHSAITFKLNQNIEDIILKKITEKIGNYFGHFAKIAIWNIKDCKNYENLKSRNIFLGIFF